VNFFCPLLQSRYFDTKKELDEFMKNQELHFGNECMIEYLAKSHFCMQHLMKMATAYIIEFIWEYVV